MSYFKPAEEIYKEMTSTLGDVDTSENNSFIYNSNMPAAMELANVLLDLDNILLKAFARLQLENGYSDYMDLRFEEMGVERKEATTARVPCVFTGAVNTTLPVGSVVGTLDNRLYVTESEITIGEDGTAEGYVLANEPGAKYNVKAGEISYFPVKYNGITSVTNLEDYTEAYDRESDEEYYKRYIFKVQNNATSGNVNHYKQWCMSVTGVGSAKIYDCTNANGEKERGCVLCVITDSNHRAASEELLQDIKDYIETQRPVGATVYVISSTELAINIDVSLVIDTISYTIDQVKATINEALVNYFVELDEDTTTNYVSINKINSIIMSCTGVKDINTLTINGSNKSVDVPVNNVAVLGNLEVSN